ncbi:spindle assembly abnormal protein 6 homolog isoform X1 [Microplitis demolitor]|uniref:spindle assembly abnormal protein 6 homolog isoform X1 n=2 Tax=Microplitis demolitor TaxID=69319 RepID=UPI00043FFDA6|nr:spindle assembly abnormal protein 6 homolog isoform X1 [Microplitis demolitor]
MNFMNSLAGNTLQSGDIAMQLNNVEVLYTKVQKVYLKPQYKEERQRELRVNVEIHSGISPVCRKTLCVLLSDDDDPCFLYSLLITEDDFKVLKAQQGLLVDFDNFATQLIHLLEQSHSSMTGTSKMPPKFLLLLSEESGDWIFKLVETNNFKHLCHLSLNISPASDSDIKTHMAMKMKQLKENLNNKNREVISLEGRLSSVNEELECKTRDLELLEQKFRAEKNQLQMTSSHQLSIERDRLAQAKLEWQRSTEIEKMDMERQHSDTLQQLHTEIAELRSQNTTYKDKQSFLEATNKEQSKQLQNLERELNLAQRDLNQLKKQNSKLDVDYHEKDKYVNDLKTRVAVMEQELKDKAILISKHMEMLKTSKEQKQQLEEMLAQKENQVQRKQNALKNVSDEVIKANEIIKKLQNDLESTKSKLKLRTGIALEQERLLDVKQKELGELQSKLDEQTKELKALKTELDSLKDQLKTMQTQLEDKEKIIKNNDNVISWLNRRLAESQSPLQSATTSAVPISIPSTFQLTLPRQNKFSTSKFETRTPITAATTTATNHSVPIAGLPLRNPAVLSNPSANQTGRLTTTGGRSTGVGITDSTVGIMTFNRPGQITSTSTPLDRLNVLNKLPGNPITTTTTTNGVTSAPAITDNNMALGSVGKSKSASGPTTLQGGLRRANSYKPLLPSAYFPKSLH